MPTREPGVFAIPGFARLWAADTISGFGAPVTLLAVQTLVLLGLHGSATDVGVITAARWLPYLLFGVLVGAVVDRRRRLPIMVATDAALGLVLLLVPLLWATHHLSPAGLAGVMVVVGVLSLFGDAASQSFVPRLVPPTRLQESHARLDQSGAVAQVGGPAIAGALVAAIGASAAVVVDAASYLVSAVLVRSIRVDEPPASDVEGRPSFAGQIREGLAWVYRQPKLGSLAVLTHGWFVCNAMLTPVFAAFVLLGLGASPFALGVALAGAGVGSLVGATVTTRVGRRLDAGPTIILSHAITTTGIAVVAAGGGLGDAWPVPVVVAVLTLGLVLHGFAMGMSNSHEMGYRQLVTPDALQARTNTTMRSVNRAMIVLGAPLGGVLADRLGSGTTLVVIAIGFGLVTVVMFVSPVRYAGYGDALPAAPARPEA
jgi:MFS family permease